MREYYHFCLTCPSCHEPHKTGVPLLSGEEYVYCPSCNVYFSPTIDVLSSKRFKQAKLLTSQQDLRFLDQLPLVWQVELNPIEQAYVDWCCEIDGGGKFLITWPWRSVKFIPLLASEYLVRNPGKRVIIVGKMHGDRLRSKKMTPAPGIADVFDRIIYFTDPANLQNGGNGSKADKLDRKDILKQTKTAQYRISNRTTNSVLSGLYPDTLKNSTKKLIDDVLDAYGEDALKKVEIKTTKGIDVNIYNTDGTIDLDLQEVMSYRGEIRYQTKWLWTLLDNQARLARPKKKFECFEENFEQTLTAKGPSVFFLDSDTDSKQIFELVARISPDLLILQDADFFIREAAIKGDRYTALVTYLNSDTKGLVLMFSSDPDVRGLYGIHSERGLLRFGVIPHTWDTRLVMESVRQQCGEESPYPSPASSRFGELSQYSILPRVDYVEVEVLDRLDLFLKELFDLFGEQNSGLMRDIKEFIYDLKRSPLFLQGDYTQHQFFKRKNQFTGQSLTFDRLMSTIYSATDRDTYKQLKAIIEEVYDHRLSTYNPLLEQISSSLCEILSPSNSFATVVVHGMDVKGTAKLLSALGLEESVSNRLLVCKWGDLDERDAWIQSVGGEHTVVATLAPPIGAAYSMFFSSALRYVFVASRSYADQIKLLIENRLVEYRSHPIHLLNDSTPAPPILREALAQTGITSSEMLDNCLEDLIVEDSYYEQKGDSSDAGVGVHYRLRIGESVFLALDKYERGIFIPRGTSLLVKEGDSLAEISVGKQTLTELSGLLENKSIVIDRRGVYASWRAIFTKLAVVYAREITFRKAGFEWKGFKHLFNDSNRWIVILKNAVKRCSEVQDTTYGEAGRRFAAYLATLELYARDSEYINGWWTNFEAVLTEQGVCRLYNVEHPKSLQDLKRIYEGIREVLPSVISRQEEADRSYLASVFIQKLRRLLLKKRKEQLDPDLYPLWISLEKEKRRIVEQSQVFTVQKILLTRLVKEVEPLRLMEGYLDFIEPLPT